VFVCVCASSSWCACRAAAAHAAARRRVAASGRSSRLVSSSQPSRLCGTHFLQFWLSHVKVSAIPAEELLKWFRARGAAHACCGPGNGAWKTASPCRHGRCCASSSCCMLSAVVTDRFPRRVRCRFQLTAQKLTLTLVRIGTRRANHGTLLRMCGSSQFFSVKVSLPGTNNEHRA